MNKFIKACGLSFLVIACQACSSNQKDAQLDDSVKPALYSSVEVTFFDTPTFTNNEKQLANLYQQREYYKKAYSLIVDGKLQEANNIKKTYLKDYPLNIYLDYYALSLYQTAKNHKAIKTFLEREKGDIIADNLLGKYIDFYAKEQEWTKLLDLFNNNAPYNNLENLNNIKKNRMCRFYEGTLRLNRKNFSKEAVEFARHIYVSSNSLSVACDSLVGYVKEKGYIKTADLFNHFLFAMMQGNKTQVNLIAKELKNTKDYGTAVESYLKIYEDPYIVLDSNVDVKRDSVRKVTIIALSKQSYKDPERFLSKYRQLNKKINFTKNEELNFKRLIADKYLSRNCTEKEIKWVDKNLDITDMSTYLMEQRLRRAIWFNQWNKVYEISSLLIDDSEKTTNWQFWYAIALQKLKQKEQANIALATIANQRNFYGFVAAFMLGIEAPINKSSLNRHIFWPQVVANNKHARRFFELYFHNDWHKSWEWESLAKSVDSNTNMCLSQWALDNNEVNLSIWNVIYAKNWDALDYRLPTAYLDLYKRYSNKNKVSLSYLYGISRQESMLNANARSPVGATGLMQLMPNTAKYLAKKNRFKYKGVKSLRDPETNINYGSLYLQELLGEYNNNRVLASAAYNAGPHRVKIWASDDGKYRNVMQYIENIPFKETRHYVQNVLLYDALYYYQINHKVKNILTEQEMLHDY